MLSLQNLGGKPSLWVIIHAPWYYRGLVGYEMGFRLVAISSDARLMAVGAKSMVDAIRAG